MTTSNSGVGVCHKQLKVQRNSMRQVRLPTLVIQEVALFAADQEAKARTLAHFVSS